jgi:hypothetical protein
VLWLRNGEAKQKHQKIGRKEVQKGAAGVARSSGELKANSDEQCEAAQHIYLDEKGTWRCGGVARGEARL